MYNFKKFSNLPSIKNLSKEEQYFKYKMYENASMSSAGAGAGAGGAAVRKRKLANITGIFGFTSANDEYLLMQITDFNLTPLQTPLEYNINYTFTGYTVFAKNPDDGMLYFVSQDNQNNQIVFGKINTQTRNVTEIDRTNLTNLTNSSPSSLFYDNGIFVYTSGLLFGNNSTVDVINITTTGIATLVVAAPQDIEYLNGTFLYSDQVYANVVDFVTNTAEVGLLDTNTGEAISAEFILPDVYPDIEIAKIFSMVSVINHNGDIYGNAMVFDKSNSNNTLFLVRIDMLTFVATYITTLPYSNGFTANIVAF